MAGFKDIIGHEQIIEHLKNAIAMDKVSHAYILNGPEESGKNRGFSPFDIPPKTVYNGTR